MRTIEIKHVKIEILESHLAYHPKLSKEEINQVTLS